MIVSMFVTFVSFMLIINHVSAKTMRRLVGYKGWFDVLMHSTILYMFLGTSTEGLMQAEAAGILFSIYVRLYAQLLGYERYVRGRGWVRYAGRIKC